jgi:hypothetical protein
LEDNLGAVEAQRGGLKYHCGVGSFWSSELTLELSRVLLDVEQWRKINSIEPTILQTWRYMPHVV